MTRPRSSRWRIGTSSTSLGSIPDWGWLLIRLDLSQKISLESLGPFAQRDLERGIRAGRFRVPNKRVALFAAGGALLGVMRDVLDGHAPKDADRHHAEGVLRMLGLSAERRSRRGGAADAQGPAAKSLRSACALPRDPDHAKRVMTAHLAGA